MRALSSTLQLADGQTSQVETRAEISSLYMRRSMECLRERQLAGLPIKSDIK